MTILVTFADKRMKKSLKRIAKQASEMGSFRQVLTFTEEDLSPSFNRKVKGRMSRKTRGFGYWCWKPEVIINALKIAKRDELIVYCDAGCHLNPNGKDRLNSYLNSLAQTDQELCAFQYELLETLLPIERHLLPDYSEYLYTKGDMFDYWKAQNRNEIVTTGQYWSGLIILKNTKNIYLKIKAWREAAITRPELFDDSPSVNPNFDRFIEHRHDQSYFSLMCKTMPTVTFSAWETWLPKTNGSDSDWIRLNQFPFQARRDKEYSGLRAIIQPLFKKYLQFKSGANKLRL